jgi:alkanesulfonate monooxygenase SsuD/methylene tetrahydromethanopterin reductase-like flavin-dependent oxidoreductase (luciferase family)
MQVWHFSEQANPMAWDAAGEGTTKITIPNQLCDPADANRLYAKYFDEWMLADELGFNIMVNEHHSSANCMSSSCTLTLAILARITRNARLLALGVPIANRPDPVRVAEELAMIDVISGGRLEMGLIKASPFELAMSNQSPARIMDRFWEAHALILKAMTHHDGPFAWQGEFFQYRNVNIWPRPLQQPTPPLWMSAAGASTARTCATLGYRLGTPANGSGAKMVFDAYRSQYLKSHGRPAPPDRLGFLALAVVGNSESEAADRAGRMKGYLKYAERGVEAYTNPPGYEPVALNVKALRQGRSGKVAYGNPTLLDGTPLPRNPSLELLAASGVLFSGTPDTVFDQIKRFSDGVGGIDHLLLHGQAGYMTHAETVNSLTLFAKEVYPRLTELQHPATESEIRAA